MANRSIEPVRVYLNANNEGRITCAECSLGRKIDLSTYHGYFGGKSLTIHCKRCTASFQVQFDYRQYRRVRVAFPGHLLQTVAPDAEPSVRAEVVITSLSVAGVGFVVRERVPLRVEETLRIRFRLDDAERSLIDEPITIKRVAGTVVGAQYTDDTYRYELDFYVMHP